MNEGVYIELFHGRADPEQDLDDWGEPGPIFGPYKFARTTYGWHLKFGANGDALHQLSVPDDMVYYDGLWYGDWSVFPPSTFLADRALQERHQPFDSAKSELPQPYIERSKKL